MFYIIIKINETDYQHIYGDAKDQPSYLPDEI